MKSFHNTIEASGDDLKTFEAKAQTQEEKIAAFFMMACPGGTEYAPSDLHLGLFDHKKVPLTSIRRALSNLTRQGILVKTGKQKRGPYGKPEYKWKLA